MLETDDDADWLLGGSKAEPINRRCKISRHTKSPHRHRVKSVGPGDGPPAWYGGLAVSVQAREDLTGPVIGLCAGSVDLIFVPLNTKVRLNIGASVLLPMLEYPRFSRGQ